MHQSKKVVFSALLLFIALHGFSQEQLGLRLGNYSGINGIMFNPASGVYSPLRWDVNLVAAGAFTENNYIFIRDASLIKVMRNRNGYVFADDLNTEANRSDGRLVYDFTRDERRKEAYTSSFVTGPSAMFRVKEHTFGVFFNFRNVVSTNRVSSSLGYYDLEPLDAGDVISVKPFKAAGMVWSEAGLNYGRKVFSKGRHTVNAGASVKFLQGYEAFYFQSHEPVDIVLNVDSMNYDEANVTFGLATGANINGTPHEKKVRGYGASLDIGAVYVIESDNKKRHYDWKFGASLLDFGKISFNRDAQAHEVNTEVAFDFIQGNYTDLNSFDDVFNELSMQSLDDSIASYVGDRFGIWTPAGLSFFAERAITGKFYVNAAVVRRLRFSGAVPERDNIWALTPRFEHRWFEASMPLVLYNDKDVRLGLALRLGPVVIGSDNLTSWFGSQNFTGSDVYFALKINPFSLSKNGEARLNSKKGNKLDDCFEFKQ